MLLFGTAAPSVPPLTLSPCLFPLQMKCFSQRFCVGAARGTDHQVGEVGEWLLWGSHNVGSAHPDSLGEDHDGQEEGVDGWASKLAIFH